MLTQIAKVAGNVATTLSDNKVEQAKIKIALQKQLMEARTSIITAEAKGSPMQRNWRPALMWLIILIIGWNYLLVPIINQFLIFFTNMQLSSLGLPDKLWNLMTIGLGGYVGGRTFEKIKTPPAPPASPPTTSKKDSRNFWPHQKRKHDG